VCNLYSITTNQAAISALFRVINRYIGNLPPMPGVFPDYPAPVIRNTDSGHESAMMRWGMPPPPRTGGPPVNAIMPNTRLILLAQEDAATKRIVYGTAIKRWWCRRQLDHRFGGSRLSSASSTKEKIMPKVIAQIPKMTDEDLLSLFKNAVRKFAEKQCADASFVLDEIALEWNKRRDQARAGRYTPRPSEGMLAALGYHVGSANGEKPSVRRKILAYVLECELPLVSSPAYSDEWGKPKSAKRFEKLIHFFNGQLTNPAHAENERAVIEWAEDLDWVRREYSHLAR
jgi:hypothetical protein